MVVLTGNGLDDKYKDEISKIFNNRKIKQVFLGKNNFKEQVGNEIGAKLKECRHITGIDVSENYLPDLANTSIFYGF